MAMAFNKPILAMLDGDGKDILNAAAGGIVSEMDIKELTKNIEKIATTDKETLKKMGDNNYNYYLKNFDVEIIAKRIEKELIELID
jgi:glycosyltransferase involved in cell wall biosynthesis